jgi:pimeloyl-ACP methyl ester carboxylesterase
MVLAHRTSGDGPHAAVFVHGFAQSSLYWQPTLERLPRNVRGYAVDLPGFGTSNAIAGPYSIAAHAAAVNDFMAEQQLERVVLVGNSMGGVVCQLLAVRHPQRLGALVLVSTGAYARNPAAARAAAEHQALARWDYAEVRRYVERFFVRAPADLEPYVEAALRATAEARGATTLSSAELDLRPELPGILVPTLIVQGGRDANRTPADGALMASLIPDAELQVIDGVGHTPMLEDPRAFTTLFHAFLARILPAAPQA